MEFTRYSAKRKVSTNTLLFILFILMLGDYIFTYLGMHVLEVVDEANYLMLWLMDMPF